MWYIFSILFVTWPHAVKRNCHRMSEPLAPACKPGASHARMHFAVVLFFFREMSQNSNEVLRRHLNRLYHTDSRCELFPAGPSFCTARLCVEVGFSTMSAVALAPFMCYLFAGKFNRKQVHICYIMGYWYSPKCLKETLKTRGP